MSMQNFPPAVRALLSTLSLMLGLGTLILILASPILIVKFFGWWELLGAALITIFVVVYFAQLNEEMIRESKRKAMKKEEG